MREINTESRSSQREIRFRGKRVDNGEWVYGDFTRHGYPYPIICNTNGFYEVISETVGQFTGLRDNNGVDIYEGDILYFNGNNSSDVVTFKDYGYECFTVEDDHKIEFLESKWYSVIGNVHDDNLNGSDDEPKGERK